MAVFEKSFLEEFMPASALAAPIAKNSKPSKCEILGKMPKFWNLKDFINIFKWFTLFYKSEPKPSALNATKCWIKFIEPVQLLTS